MAITPKITCGKCGNPLRASDKFCGSCGTPVEWAGGEEQTPASPAPPANAGGTVRCQVCGHENPAQSASCTSCGTALPGARAARTEQKKKPAAPKQTSAKTAPPTFLQSWKFIVVVALILVAAVILYKNTQPTTAPNAAAPTQEMSPNAAAAVEQIESLQRVVDANPKDADNTLRLANMLHDVRMFPRAATMYARYLQLNPSNPDARVDLGTTYFELSMTDTTRRLEYLRSAKQEMEKAITYAPKHQLAHFNLGIISLHDGSLDDAMRWFSKCVAIDSTTEAAKRANQLLHQHTLTNTK